MRLLLPVLLAAAMAATLHSTEAQPGPSPQMALLTEKEACMLLPAEVIAGPGVDGAVWSTTGRFALLRKNEMRIPPEMIKDLAAGKPPQGPPPGEIGLVLWDVKGRQATTIWKRPSRPGANIVDYRWLNGTDIAVAIVDETFEPSPTQPGKTRKRHSLLRINGPAAFAKVVSFTDNEVDHEPNFVSLDPSPVLPMAMVESMTVGEPGANRHVIQFIRDRGPLGQPIVLTEKPMFANWGWCREGSAVRLISVERGENGRPVRHYFVLDIKTGKVQETAKIEEPTIIAEKIGDLRLKSGSAVIKEGETSRKVSPLWLESVAPTDRPRAMVSSDCTWSKLSPKQDGVLYCLGGYAYSAQIIRFPKEIFLAMEAQAQRAVALSNGKQLGLGILMYAQDYDENYPNGDNINGKLDPYLKNSGLFNGFTYTFGGGAMKDITSPAETELGYVTGPGGRAVIYADGHVKWRND